MILVKSEYLYDRFLDTDDIQHAYIESSSTHRHVKGTEAEKYWVVVQMTGGSVTLGNDVHSLYKRLVLIVFHGFERNCVFFFCECIHPYVIL